MNVSGLSISFISVSSVPHTHVCTLYTQPEAILRSIFSVPEVE
jgi:hypothetical protein